MNIKKQLECLWEKLQKKFPECEFVIENNANVQGKYGCVSIITKGKDGHYDPKIFLPPYDSNIAEKIYDFIANAEGLERKIVFFLWQESYDHKKTFKICERLNKKNRA